MSTMTDDFANIVSICSFLRMVFNTEDKELIKNLYLLKGHRTHRLLAEFPTKNWTLGGLDYLLKKLRQTGTRTALLRTELAIQ